MQQHKGMRFRPIYIPDDNAEQFDDALDKLEELGIRLRVEQIADQTWALFVWGKNEYISDCVTIEAKEEIINVNELD